MFGPDWDAPCPSCTSLVDVFNANYHPVSQHCAMAVVAAAHPKQFRDWAQVRGWTLIPLHSAAKGSYILDYFAREGASDPALVSMMNVFRKTPRVSSIPGIPSIPGTPGARSSSATRWKTATRVTWTWCGRSGTCST